jgi:hypothetical protein
VKPKVRKPTPAIRIVMMLIRPIFSRQALCCSGLRMPE